MMSAISVIIPTFSRKQFLLRVLEAYDRQITPDPFEIIVVDDASQDGTYETLVSYRPSRFNLRIERMDRNRGQGQARNHAIPVINSPLVLFTGDDILPREDFIEGHLTAHRCYPDTNTAILGKIEWPNDIPRNTLMNHIDGRGAEQFSYFYLKEEQVYDFRHFYTSNVSLKRELLWSLERWFDPDFVMYGFEDAELGYRLSKLGMKILYSSAPLAYHYHYHNIFTFSDRQYKSGLMACVLVKKHPELSNIIFGRKWHTTRTLLLGFKRAFSPNAVDWLEEVSLRLASYYEWSSRPWLDDYYSQVLYYYFQKGTIDGLFGKSRFGLRLRGANARQSLLSALTWFFQNAEQTEALDHLNPYIRPGEQLDIKLWPNLIN